MYDDFRSLSRRDPKTWFVHLAHWSTEWFSTNGVVLLHVAKTVVAALLALGISMVLELPAPRTAMTTVFIVMQPMSGMVLAKSFYRVLGTALGLVAAIAIVALFAQTPELYLGATTIWTGFCTAAAVRHRHFRWYAFVLAGYTAILIAIPTVDTPNGVYMSALTRVSEVSIGVLCSAAISALVFPVTSSDALLNALRSRYTGLMKLASEALTGHIEENTFESRFSALVDGMVGLEASRTFAIFEGPLVHVRSRRIARLNNEFSHTCTRLHSFYQLLRRLDACRSPAVQLIEPHLREFSKILSESKNLSLLLDDTPSVISARFRKLRPVLVKAIKADRTVLRGKDPAVLIDFDTATELLLRFVAEFIRYVRTYDSLKSDTHALEKSSTQYAITTNRYVVAFTMLRTVAAVGVVAWFWEATAWPSGAFAIIGAAITCALTSLSPNAAKQAWQMAIGTVGGIAASYIYMCYVYPNIDGFPLLCVFLAPVLAAGAYFIVRRGTTAYGVGFAVYFCLLVGPDNVIVYTPDKLINNGIALVASMCVSAIVFAVVFPAQMPWLVRKIERELRAQVSYAFHSELPGLDQRFHSITHDIMAQLRPLLVSDSARHREALQWLFATLEVGHAAIDLRRQVRCIAGDADGARFWHTRVDAVGEALSTLFLEPGQPNLLRACDSVEHAVFAVHTAIEQATDAFEAERARRALASLHFFRTVLLDRENPFLNVG